MTRRSRLASLMACGLFAAAALIARASLSAQAQAPGQGTAKPQAADAKAAPATAQNKAAADKQEKKAPEAEQPEDFKAFNEASKITDPLRQIEAFQKFAADYPDSLLVPTASTQEFNTTFSTARDTIRKLRAGIDKSIEAGHGSLSAYASVVSRLSSAGIMLDDAEKLALKGLESNDVTKFIQAYRDRLKGAASGAAAAQPAPAASPDAKPKGTNTGTFRLSRANGVTTATWVPPDAGKPAAAARTPRPELTDEELKADYLGQRATLMAALGQIYVKEGKLAEAEKTLEEVYASAGSPASARGTAARELAAIAKKAGDDKAQMEYLMTSVVLGAQPAVRLELDDLFKKAHNGSLDGLDALLDERYKKTLKPLGVKPYVRPVTATPRLAVAELFTGAACPPCVGADLAWDAALERFGRQDLALLVYHEHIPGPDPMTNPSTVKRLDFYGVRGVPTFYVDGVTDDLGGGGADQAEPIFSKRISPAVEKALAVKPSAKITLTAKLTGAAIAVKAGVGPIAGKSDTLRLQIALVEEHRTYSGANGVRFHSMVVRNLAAPETPKAKGQPAKAKVEETPAKDDKAKEAQPKDAPPADAAAKETKVVEPTGFPVAAARGANVSYVFDVAKIVAENRAAIDEFLAKPFRGGDKPIFAEREDDIDPARLLVVAFVQDEATRKILQGATVAVAPVSKK